MSDADYYIGDAYNSSKVSSCTTDLRYDCHGFVIGYMENGCQPSPNFYYTPAYYCSVALTSRNKSDWQNSGKYIKVCDEASANVVWYDVTGSSGSGHSAVKVGNGNYLSKYGNDGPLVRHTLNGSYYHQKQSVNSTEFWTYLGNIQGTSNVVGTSSQNYSITSLSGLSYSWSIVSGSENIFISSQSSNTATLSPLHSGSAVLSVTITSACGSTIQQFAINVQTNICLEGSFTTSSVTNKILGSGNSVAAGWVNVNVTCPNASSYTWQRTSGSINFYNSGSFASFTMPSGGSISFLITAKNSSNTTLQTRNVSFYNYGSFRAISNPISSSLKIDIADGVVVSVNLESLKNKAIKKEFKEYESKSTIDISDLEEGDYVLKVYHLGKLVNEERLRLAH